MLDLLIHFMDDQLQRLPVENALGNQPLGKFDDRVARLFGCALGLGLIETLVVGKRMRIRPRHGGMHQRRPLAGARMRHRFGQRLIRRHEIRAVHFHALQIREARDQARDVSARRLPLHRHRNGVAVVLDQKHQRQVFQARRVHRFPELALAGGALAARYQRHFVRRRIQISVGLRAARRLHKLRAGGRRSGDDVQLGRAPVRGHLASAGIRIGRRSHGPQQHLLGRDAQHQTQRAVAIVKIKPIMPRPQNQPRGGLHGLVSGAADLKKDAILPFQQNLPVV